MKLVKYGLDGAPSRVGILRDNAITSLDLKNAGLETLTDILESPCPRQAASKCLNPSSETIPLARTVIRSPVEGQEVWAAGVTYKRSQSARMEESKSSASCYDRVYRSERPELFFKATPNRVADPGAPIRIRSDSSWNVPEPELALVLNSRMELVGLTIGNDMSSRDIEGENPLYLPQAKVYDQCCSLGPSILLVSLDDVPATLEITMHVARDGQRIYEEKTNTSEMARSLPELIDWLARDDMFPHGVFLMTGTGIVPDNRFSLEPGDQVDITIEKVGTLSNTVKK